MLTPEDLEKAGELVGSVYADAEAEMLDYLTAKMIDGDIAGQRSQTAILLLAQSSTQDLRAILDDHGYAIDEAVRKEVGDALRRSDADDLAKIKRGLGVDLPGITSRQTAATVAGVEDILARHNLQMEQAAKDAFIRCSSEAITMVNTGAMTAEQALHRAVRKLERDGVSIIQYQNAETGAKTVANKLDVAVRRHVRAQIAQDGARMTELRMDEAGIEFVEVSSHAGARPSHQAWEGKVYSRHGRKTVGGVTYEDFRTACHWGDVGDGIYGANCRHSHGPWIPGTPRTYEKDPKHPSGLDNDDIYKLNQKQREMERDIRATKRELRGCEIEYGRTGAFEAQADAAKLKKKLRGQQAKLREHIDTANARCKPGASVLQRSPRREWAGDMPMVKVPAISGRKIDDVLGMPSVAKKIEGAGTSKTRLRAQLISELKDDGLAPQSFRWLTAKQQGGFLRRALDKLTGNAKAATGSHVRAFAFTPAATKTEAEAFARATFGAEADFSGLHIGAINALNESVARHIDQFPELRGNFGFVGSTQAGNRERKRLWADYYYQANQGVWQTFGLTDAQARKRAERLAAKTVGRSHGEWAWSYSPKPQHADYSMRGIYMNQKTWKDEAAYNQQLAALDRDVKSKYHPEGTATPKAIFDHEVGHQLDTLLDISNDPGFMRYWSALSPQEVEDGLSGYARKYGKREFVAEGWSEYQNNPRPRPHAEFVGRLILKKYAALGGTP